MRRARDQSKRSKNGKRGVTDIKRMLTSVLLRHDVARAALFGSFARGEGAGKSDLDVLIEFRGEKTLLDLVALKLDLEVKTGRKVDVLTYRSLHPALRDRILNEQVIIYE